MATYTGADKRLQYLFEHGGGGGGSANIWTGTLAEYIAQASQIPDDTLVNITDDEIQSLVVASYDVYSTQEKEVGVFVDGKPLYQKTINTGALPNNTTKNVNHNISDIDTVVTAFGFAKASGINWIPIPFVNNTAYTDQVALFVNPSTITLRTSGDRSAYGQSYVTIKYTKTTDTAGSGLFVPSGALAEHYSTTEQIIGTWIDGNTLYQTTIQIPFSELTTDNAQLRYNLGTIHSDWNIKNAFGFARSETYGICQLGATNYKGNAQNSGSWNFSWYYTLLVLRSSDGINDLKNSIKPSIEVTLQYTKNA